MENELNQNQQQEQQQGQEEAPKTYTQEDLDKLLQENSNNIAGKIRAEEKKKYDAKLKEIDEQAKQQAKFEKMSELDKQTEIARQAQEQLKALQDKIALTEQRDETRKLMKDKGLPDVFLDSVLVFQDADATIAKIAEVKALFDAEVQKAVEGRMKTHVPKGNGGNQEEGISLEDAKKALGIH